MGTPVSDTNWTLRFIYDVNTIDIGSTRTKYFWIGLFSGDETADSETVQDAIAFEFFVNSTTPAGRLSLSEKNGVILTGTGTQADFTTVPSITDIQYIELRRTSATSAECTIYSDQDYTNVVETVTLTIPAGIVSLRYIGLKNRTDPANTGSMTGIIDDVQFWNGKDRFEHKNRWDEVNT